MEDLEKISNSEVWQFLSESNEDDRIFRLTNDKEENLSIDYDQANDLVSNSSCYIEKKIKHNLSWDRIILNINNKWFVLTVE